MDEEMEPIGTEETAPAVSEMPSDSAYQDRQITEAEKKLVRKLLGRIEDDCEHHKKAFEQMREDMRIARIGAAESWAKGGNYIANITNRHINQSVAALYAKNPKAIARRRERLDFKVWDENQESLLMALQTMQTAMPLGVDPMSGQPIYDPMVQQAQAVLQDYQRGMLQRQMAQKIGKTLELLYDYFMKEQTPVDFKTSMKQLVRRAKTTGVGYIKLNFQRQFQQDPAVTQRLADFQQQLLEVERLRAVVEEGKDPQHEVKELELQTAVKSLQEQEFVLIREGLTFDFPSSTAVIPDKMTRALTGFVGARWLTIKHLYTPEEVKRNFKVDLGKDYKPHYDDGSSRASDQYEMSLGGDDDRTKDARLACVYEHYDRETGTVYLLCDGYHGFLREPGAPDVYVDDFWPVGALTFNEVEDESCLFPPSDVRLMIHMQQEYNRTRQGLREHRKVARPRFVTPKGTLDDEDKQLLVEAEPFEVISLNALQAGQSVTDIIQPIPTPGVDPNIYDTSPFMNDIQLAVGSQEAQFGAVSKATATESSIAEGSRVASIDSNVDDLDAFLTRVARWAGQILLREMSPQSVTEIVGEGAVWPQLTLDQISKEIYLEIEAGSSGKPNQAQEIRNWKEMLPFLIQMPNINPVWLARESIRRLDDRMDLTEAITENIPAIVAMNRMAGAAPAPGALPEDQGGAGADNTSVPGGPAGTDAPLGNNQQPV